MLKATVAAMTVVASSSVQVAAQAIAAAAYIEPAVVTRRLAGASEGYNFMFYFVIGAMMLTCLIYNIFFKHKMEATFLRQHALPETMLRQDVIARCARVCLSLFIDCGTLHD